MAAERKNGPLGPDSVPGGDAASEGGVRHVEVRILSGVHRDAIVRLSNDVLVIGSHPECDVVLSDPGVAPRHLGIRWKDGSWWARPLNPNGSVLFKQRRMPPALTRLGGRVVLDVGEASLELTPSPAASSRARAAQPARSAPSAVRIRSTGARGRSLQWLGAIGLAAGCVVAIGSVRPDERTLDTAATSTEAPADVKARDTRSVAADTPMQLASLAPPTASREHADDRVARELQAQLHDGGWPHVALHNDGARWQLKGHVRTESDKSALRRAAVLAPLRDLRVSVVSAEEVANLVDQFVADAGLTVGLSNAGRIVIEGRATSTQTKDRLTKLEKDLRPTASIEIRVSYMEKEASEQASKVWETSAAKAGWRVRQVNSSAVGRYMEMQDGARFFEGARLGSWEIVRILPEEVIVKDGARTGVVTLE